mmetsp:Transcript_44280/g.106669  ORF Transcript_44280/g.106669 Transcript_44280/m.106669 type:complete len:673 (-) Transcript_44280:74-2092(-)|eukprot:CAMPEP_0113622042 /NCGR_PEP_ID=MMETSP0017_2-20120614/11283_1 /TAXON_ID=2856 /ORGANISM="Cylindrotheca closterium" /LENGTH=672 /DNA_ID=CAMNT_0000531839 /DNA_START=73 /DNA_END=2091 /DNA_ORIENTATION=- /assembly_acc=CAM_ASM_000147
MAMGSCNSNRWIFAFLFLFTASKYECLRTSGSILLFAAAQQKPNFTTPQYSNITHRTDVCNRFALYVSGKLDIKRALENFSLTVGIVDQGNDIFFRLDGRNKSDPNQDPNELTINMEDPGIFAHILDELAFRGGFTWRNSFAYVQPPQTDKIKNKITNETYSWTDVLLDAVQRYDFSFAEWVHNQERRRLGISFPVGWFDASTIIVQNQVEKKAEFEYTAFLRPFSTEVWYLICAVIFFSGIMYWMIDKVEYPDDKINTVVYDTFLTTLTFTQHHQYWDPSTHGKRIFGYSAAFWALILASAYTANLASFLVAQQRPIILAETLDEVEQDKLPLCVRAGAAVEGQIKKEHGNAVLRRFPKFEDVYTTLTGDMPVEKGGCDLMASRAADFDAFRNNEKLNPKCSLEWVGRAAFINKGGPGTFVDTSVKCTSLIKHVLDVHMHDMLADGVIESLWNSHLRSLPDYTVCAASTLGETQSLDGEYALQVTDVGGVFVFHGVLIFISIIVTAIESPWRRKRHRKKAARLETDGTGSEYEEASVKPSMESLSKNRSMKNLVGAEMTNFYQVYSDFDDSYGNTVEDSIRDSIRAGESFHLPSDGLLRRIGKMQKTMDQLQRQVEAARKRKMEANEGNATKRGSKQMTLVRLPSTNEVNEEEHHPSDDALSSGGNPNEGK